MNSNLVAAVVEWGQRAPRRTGVFEADAKALAAWHATSSAFLSDFASSQAHVAVAREEWRKHVQRTTSALFRHHIENVLALAGSLHPATVVQKLAESLPGIAPSARELEQDARRPLAEKVGVEYKAAVMLAGLLADPHAGERLMREARRPCSRALDSLAAFQKDGQLDMGHARIRRDGPAALVEISSTNALNSEDDSVLDALEVCVDIALLDDRVQIGILRGAPVHNRAYANQRVFCSGLNLFKLYDGEISYSYYVKRELGLVNKIYRGLYLSDDDLDLEKPWLAAVDTHAIGGGCQLLLVVDYVVAERGARLSLPARKEGIIPGAANLRLPRFVGPRAASQAILIDRSLSDDGEQHSPLVDESVAREEMDATLQRVVDTFVSAGPISLAANRKALRIGQESVEDFRQYISHFALAQADCHFSRALAENLERHWIATRDRGAQSVSSPHPSR